MIDVNAKISFTYTYPVNSKDINGKYGKLIYKNQVYDFKTDQVHKNPSPAVLSSIRNLKENEGYDMALNLVINQFGGMFAKNDNVVYYVGYRPDTKNLTGVDVKTFEQIEYSYYCKDKNNIFYFDDVNKKFYPIHCNLPMDSIRAFRSFILIDNKLYYKEKALRNPFGNDIELRDIMHSGEAKFGKISSKL